MRYSFSTDNCCNKHWADLWCFVMPCTDSITARGQYFNADHAALFSAPCLVHLSSPSASFRAKWGKMLLGGLCRILNVSVLAFHFYARSIFFFFFTKKHHNAPAELLKEVQVQEIIWRLPLRGWTDNEDDCLFEMIFLWPVLTKQTYQATLTQRWRTPAVSNWVSARWPFRTWPFSWELPFLEF